MSSRVFGFGFIIRWMTVFCLLVVSMSEANAYDLKNNAVLHGKRGQLWMARGQYDLAIEELKAAIRLNPYTTLSASLYNNLGLAYRQTGNYPMAFAAFQHACRIHPTYALYYKNLIESYAAAGRLLEVEKALLAIIKGNPDNAEVWFMLGLLYQEQGSEKSAKACFSRFLKLQPNSELARAAQASL